MKAFATYIAELLGMKTGELEDLTGAALRYSMYKVGPVISVSVSFFILHFETSKCEISSSAWYGTFLYQHFAARTNQINGTRKSAKPSFLSAGNVRWTWIKTRNCCYY